VATKAELWAIEWLEADYGYMDADGWRPTRPTYVSAHDYGMIRIKSDACLCEDEGVVYRYHGGAWGLAQLRERGVTKCSGSGLVSYGPGWLEEFYGAEAEWGEELGPEVRHP
jgi:hypothetical protein